MASWYDRYRQFAQAQWEPTVLSSQEEAAFREWLIKSKWFQQIRDDVAASGERMDDTALYDELTGARADYDYRGAWKAGVGAVRRQDALALVHDGRKDAEKPETPYRMDGVFHAGYRG